MVRGGCGDEVGVEEGVGAARPRAVGVVLARRVEEMEGADRRGGRGVPFGEEVERAGEEVGRGGGGVESLSRWRRSE